MKVLVAAVLSATLGCDDHRPRDAVVQLSSGEIGVHTVLGAEAQGDPNSVIGKALDGVLLQDCVAILDGTPPYVRFFDFQGNYVGSTIPNGIGPEELRRPLSIGRLEDGSVVVNEPSKLLRIGVDGEVLQTIVDSDQFLRGAVGCGEAVLALSTPVGFEQPGRLTVSELGISTVPDTVLYLDSIRGNSRRAHPFLAHSADGQAVLYTEETTRDRLVAIDCETLATDEIPLDSLGPQEFWEPLGDDRYALHPAAAPRPGGVAAVGGEIFWARHEVSAKGQDSATVITAVSEASERRPIRLQGWYTLADASADHLLLVSRVPVSHAVIVDREAFEAVVQAEYP